MVMPVPPPAQAAPATNAVGGKPDASKIQALLAELSSISKELHPQEDKLRDDPEIKALFEKQEAARQVVMELGKQQRELMDKKMSADPSLATLVVRRHEIQQTLKEMRPAMGGNPMGGPHSRMMPPPMDGKTPEMMPTRIAPAPLAPGAAPDAVKPVAGPQDIK